MLSKNPFNDENSRVKVAYHAVPSYLIQQKLSV